MRWGIFWRSIKFDLDVVALIIEASMLLHNFIIDERTEEQADNDKEYFRNFSVSDLPVFKDEQCIASVSDNNASHPTGCPPKQSEIEQQIREDGDSLREGLVISIASNSMQHPMETGMEYNS